MKSSKKNVLILGANSDVAKQCILLYLRKGYDITAASRDLSALESFILQNEVDVYRVRLVYLDVCDFSSHPTFYNHLKMKPDIVIYAAGFLAQNQEVLRDFDKGLKMMQTNYAGAVSLLNIIANDQENTNLHRIIGLSSLSGVRGRRSNYIYGSTKAAFTQYLAGLRQELAPRKIIVNVLISGYINTKINIGLKLNRHLIMKADDVAHDVVNAGKSFTIVPNWKWKLIYRILKWAPEFLVAKLP